jgi:hypothetical protein
VARSKCRIFTQKQTIMKRLCFTDATQRFIRSCTYSHRGQREQRSAIANATANARPPCSLRAARRQLLRSSLRALARAKQGTVSPDP